MWHADKQIIAIIVFLSVITSEISLSICTSEGNTWKNTSPFLYRETRLSIKRNSQYYSWNDGFDYEMVCLRMKEYISMNEARTIHCLSHLGGLGHKYRSISLSIMYALLLGRKFNLILPDNFLTTTSNCFNFTNQMQRSLDIPLVNKTDCALMSSNTSIASLFGDRDVEIVDCRIPNRIIAREYEAKLEGKIINAKFNYFLKIVYRILLNPIPEIQLQLQKYKHHYFLKYNRTLGIQFRTGGCLADYRERREMSSLEDLIRLPSYIQDVMNKTGMIAESTLIYISTDSTIAEKYLRRTIGQTYHILSANIFKRSHSSFDLNVDVVKRNLIDLYLLAECDTLIFCAGSGFGHVAYQLSKSNNRFMYRITRRNLPVIQLKVQCDENIIEWIANQTKS